MTLRKMALPVLMLIVSAGIAAAAEIRVLLAKAAAPAEAMEFIRLLASARSGDKWRAAALEPVAAYQPTKAP